MKRPSFLPDPFLLYLIGTVTLASLLPAQGVMVTVLSYVTTAAISLLFFLHGAKLSRQAIVAGIGHWRLQLMTVGGTFVLFPLLGWAAKPFLDTIVSPELSIGVLYLCALPATVQSAIALVSIARGNIPAAICSASASTLLGVILTPILVGMLISQSAGSANPWEAVGRIGAQLLLPFILGHLARPWLAEALKRRAVIVKVVDQGSILLVVYAAFSNAVIAGIWSRVPIHALAGVVLVCAVLLACALVIMTFVSRKLGFSKEDEIAIVFCGSTKSLVTGVPMASVLFVPDVAGVVVLPLMVFHQMQLMVCAVLAQRYARREAAALQAA